MSTVDRLLENLLRPLDYLLEFIFPSSCLICGTPTPCARRSCITRNLPLETLFCPQCRKELAAPITQFCLRCGCPIPHSSNSGRSHRCSRKRNFFSYVCPLQRYRGIARAVVLSMKRDKSRILATAVARLYYNERQELLINFQPDCVVSVPMHWKRLFSRGRINAPEIIARRLALELRIPCYSKYIKRKRSTVTQTSVTWNDRFINVYEAFEISEFNVKFRLFLKGIIKKTLKSTWSLFPYARDLFSPLEREIKRYTKSKLSSSTSAFAGKRIIIVDDVITTGSTVNEISRILLEVGAAEIMVVTIARAGLGNKRRN